MSGFIGNTPVPKASQIIYRGKLSAPSSTITVPGGYTPGNIVLFINGLRINDNEYTATNGSTIDLGSSFPVDTFFCVEELRGFEVATHYTKQEAIDKFVDKTNLNGGQFAGFRNKIINGKMEIAQRGTNFVGVTTGTYVVDRFFGYASGGAILTLSQQSDVPSSNEFQSSFRAAVTTADTSIAAGDVAGIAQLIEGFNARDLIGRAFTLSFWVRSSKTGTHCVAFRNAGPDRTFVAEYTINAANTWEFKTVTVNGGLITAGTWDWVNGVGVNLGFALAAGSTFHTTAGAWQTGNFFTTANQVNCLDAAGNVFAITGVQLEVGEVATPFEHRPFGAELALCQRYYETIGWGYTSTAISANSFEGAVPFTVEKRAAPTISALGGSVTLIQAGINLFTASTPTVGTAFISLRSCRLDIGGFTDLITGRTGYSTSGIAAASAEL